MHSPLCFCRWPAAWPCVHPPCRLRDPPYQTGLACSAGSLWLPLPMLCTLSLPGGRSGPSHLVPVTLTAPSLLSPHPCKAVAAHPQTLSATPSIGLNLPSGSSLPDLCPYCLPSLNTWLRGHHPLPPSPWLNLGSPLGLIAPQCQCLTWSLLLLLVPNVHVYSPVCLLFHGKTQTSTRAGLYPQLSSLSLHSSRYIFRKDG